LAGERETLKHTDKSDTIHDGYAQSKNISSSGEISDTIEINHFNGIK
jgi:hypothetical protein